MGECLWKGRWVVWDVCVVVYIASRSWLQIQPFVGEGGLLLSASREGGPPRSAREGLCERVCNMCEVWQGGTSLASED